MNNLKIVFFGTPDFVLNVLHSLNAAYNLVAVVTTPDQPVGRQQTLTPSPVKLAAQQLKIPVLTPKILDNEFVQNLEKGQPDLFIVASYGKIIPANILTLPKLGAINIHPSLLPKYRGATPVQNAILNGDETTGVTLIKMDEKMDHGPILLQREFPITPHSTFESLVNSLFGQSIQMIPEAIENLENNRLQEQNHDQAIFTKLTKKEDGYFDIDNPPPSEQLDRMIRAYYPWPNAWTKWNNRIVKFLPDQMVQMEGKKAVKLRDFLNGYPNFPIKDLG